MKRFLLISLTLCGLFLAGLLGSYLILMKSGFGQQLVFRTLTPFVESQFGIIIEAEEVGGSWPEDLHVTKLKLSDADGVWFYADHADLVWHPLAWLDNHAKIDFILLTDAEYYRAPNLPSSDDEQTTNSFTLPLITINDSVFENVRISEDVLGEAVSIGGKAVAQWRQNSADAEIKLNANSGGVTHLDAALHWDRHKDVFDVTVDLKEGNGGVIGKLAKIKGTDPLFLTISGEGPASDWRGEVDGSWPAVAGIKANVACDCRDFATFTLQSAIELGSGAPPDIVNQLGAEFSVIAEKSGREDTEVYDIEITSARGPLNLTVEHADKRAGRTFSLSGTLRPAETPQNEALLKLGSQINLTAEIERSKKRTVVPHLSITSSNAEVLVTDATWKGRQLGGGAISGKVLLDPWANMPDALSANQLSLAVNSMPVGRERLDLTGEISDTHGLIVAQLEGNIQANLQSFNISLAGESTANALDELLTGIDVRTPIVFGASFKREARLENPDMSISADASWANFNISGDDVRNLEAKLSASNGNNIFGGTLKVDGEARKFDMYLPIEASTEFNTGESGPVLSNLIARLPGAELSGDVALSSVLPSGTLRLEVSNLKDVPFVPSDWEGSFTLRGSSRDKERIEIDLQAPFLTLGSQRVSDLSLRGSGTNKNLILAADLGTFGDPTSPLIDQLASTAIFSLADRKLTLTSLAAIAADERVTLEKPTAVRFEADDLHLDPLTLTTSTGGRLSAEIIPTPKALRAVVTTDKILIPSTVVAATGRAELDTGENRATLEMSLVPVSPASAPQLKLNGSWNGNTAKVEGAVYVPLGDHETLQRPATTTPLFALSLPTPRSEEGNVEIGEIDGKIDYRGRLKDLLAFLDLDRQSADGALTINGEIRGPLGTPYIRGDLNLEGAHYVHDIAGIDVMNAQVSARFEGTPSTAKGSLSLTAHDGSSTQASPAYTATAAFERTEALPVKLKADAKLNRAAIIQRDDLTAKASADLSLEGALDDLGLTGDISVEDVAYTIPTTRAAKVQKLNIVRVDVPAGKLSEEDVPNTGFMSTVRLNVNVNADNRIYVRGRGLDTEWSAALKATGTAETPVLDGNVGIVRGFLDFGGRRFDFEKGRIRLDPNGGLDPFLDIAASNLTKEDIKAGLRVRGRGSAPKISLYAEPSLPEEDVMAYVLFGKPAQNLSSLEALQVARAVASLTGTGGLGGPGILDKARRFAGVDVLSVSTEGDAVGLSVGKYIRDGIYVSANQDLSGQAGSVSLEIEATKNITLETDVGQDADASVSINWKRDY